MSCFLKWWVMGIGFILTKQGGFFAIGVLLMVTLPTVNG